MSEKIQEKSSLVKDLESIFTIDGKGRPAKAKKFLDLTERYDDATIRSVIREMSEREFF